MLYVENLKKITSLMKKDALAYAEEFWQEVFNNIADEYLSGRLALVVGGYFDINSDIFPVDHDHYRIFRNLSFGAVYDCFGELKITFHRQEGDEIAFHLSEEVLIKNHFSRTDELEFVLRFEID